MTDKTTNAATLAAAFGITTRRVQQLAADGVLPKSGRGSYPLVGAVRAYIAHALAGQSATNEPDDLVEARRQLLVEQTRRERRLNMVAEGRLVEQSFLEEVTVQANAAVIGGIEALPGRCAADLVGMTNSAEIRMYLLDEVRRIRSMFAKAIEGLVFLPDDPPERCPLCKSKPWSFRP